MDQPLALSPLTTIIATASRQGLQAASVPAAPSPAPTNNRKLLQGGGAPAPAPTGAAANGTSTPVKLSPDFAITEGGGGSASPVSTGAPSSFPFCFLVCLGCRAITHLAPRVERGPARSVRSSRPCVAARGRGGPGWALPPRQPAHPTQPSVPALARRCRAEYGDLLKASLGGDLVAYKLLSSNQVGGWREIDELLFLTEAGQPV